MTTTSRSDTPVPRQLSEEERALWEKASAATAGPWVPMVIVQGGLVEFPAASDHFVVGSYPVDGGGSVLAICGPTKGEDAAKSLADAEFIAAANPAVILSLLTALSSEREAGERDKARIDAIEAGEVEIECMGTTVPYQWARGKGGDHVAIRTDVRPISLREAIDRATSTETPHAG